MVLVFDRQDEDHSRRQAVKILILSLPKDEVFGPGELDIDPPEAAPPSREKCPGNKAFRLRLLRLIAEQTPG
ncbi:hypothetical protein [Caulobacter rhizosphaerae]|jgi:hypothetical protein|uniref:hypothetical protein n=1 Tax=Caulobacter rhizosphaerae TaxID=2010972 RepID=UPI00166B1929|nr:hypothetical protein [Caulobacter rhizosphaerae]